MSENKPEDSGIFTWANLVTALRLPIAIPAIYLMWIDSNKFVILGIFILAYLTDILDGFIARKFNQFSEFGKMLDPLIDKIITSVSFLVLIISPAYYMPLWIVIVVVGKDILLLVGGVILLGNQAKTIQANVLGKIAVLLVSAGGLSSLMGLPRPYIDILFIICAAGQVAAFIYYLTSAIQIRKKLKTENV